MSWLSGADPSACPPVLGLANTVLSRELEPEMSNREIPDGSLAADSFGSGEDRTTEAELSGSIVESVSLVVSKILPPTGVMGEVVGVWSREEVGVLGSLPAGSAWRSSSVLS